MQQEDSLARCSWLPADDAFGPVTRFQCGPPLFDFTLLFEQCVLCLVPAAIFLLLAPGTARSLLKATVKRNPSPAHYTRLFVASSLVAAQLLLLVFWSLDRSTAVDVSIPAAALELVAAGLVLLLTNLEYARALRGSGLLAAYLFLTAVFGIVQARSLFIRNAAPVAATTAAVAAIKLGLLLLVTKGSRANLKDSFQQLPPETTSGLLSRTLFWWLNPLFSKAFQSWLSGEDLPTVDIQIDSEALGRCLEHAWEQCGSKAKPPSRYALVYAVHKALLRPFLAILFPRICLIGFNFAQPFLITRILNLLVEPSDVSSDAKASGLIAATLVVYLGIAICNVHFYHFQFRFITMFRGAVVTLIFNKTLLLPCDQYDESAALTLMSTDMDRMAMFFEYFHMIWARFIEVAIGTALLALQLGPVSVVPLIIVALSFGANSIIASFIGDRQKRWVEAIQQRVAMAASMLNSMKSIKMGGLSGKLFEQLHSQRQFEIERQAAYRWISVWLNIIAEIPTIMAPVATFVAYTVQATIRGSASLDLTQAFTSLAIITLTTGPAEKLLSAIPGAASALSSFDRVQKFLLTCSHRNRTTDSFQLNNSIAETEDASLKAEKGHSVVADDANTQDPAMRRQRAIALSADKICLRPAAMSSFCLRDIRFELEEGSLGLIVGPVGSGKSTLIKALLGELQCDKGSRRTTNRKVSYCSQQPWLSNRSIRNNICGPFEETRYLDAEWYNAVLRACALDTDIAKLKRGDNTVVGSKGMNLSGGQKQRVALARAFYARNRLFLLDDVLSALDESTERAVFTRLFGADGLARKLGATVVLATHSTKWMSLSDRILILRADGSQAQYGNYTELKNLPQGLDGALTIASEPDEGGHDAVLGVTKDDLPPAIQELSEPPAEAQDPHGTSLVTYFYYFKAAGWRNFTMFAGFAACTVFASSFSQVWLQWWVDDGSHNFGQNIAIYVVLGVIQLLCQGSYYWSILVRISPTAGLKLHQDLLKSVINAPMSFFSNVDTGVTLNRFSQDMTLIETPLALGFLFTLLNLFLAVAQLGLVVSGSYFISVVVPVILIVVFLLQKIYLRTSRQIQILDLEMKNPIYSHFLETLSGATTIRAYGWQAQSKRIHIKNLDLSQRPYYLLWCIQRWLNLVLDLIVAATATLTVALALKVRSSTSQGLLGISLNNVLSFNLTLQSFITGWTMLETSLGAVTRLRSFTSQTDSEDPPGDQLYPPAAWPQHGDIVFNDIHASYIADKPILNGVSFSIKSGQKVGLCGRTGSGKSTILSLLTCLLDPTSGGIAIDGISIFNFAPEETRKRLLTLPQEPFLLTGSVRLNVDPMGHFADENIVDALEKCLLWPDPLLLQRCKSSDTQQARDNEAPLSRSEGSRIDSPTKRALDSSLQTSGLSAGQIQLLALARALLRKHEFKIVLMDEATSAMDLQTDRTIHRVIRDEFRDHTVISVAHRVEAMSDMDLVVELETGRVKELRRV